MSVIFWKILTAACLVWYAAVTVYVAGRGFGDIRRMLRNLAAKRKE
ncbi:MAG TPA: hypothetical protein VMZ49_06665 [Patescibacteria group bacterium]|nr:hypothetical protein [Patescibacteria group bacterium]